MAMRPPFTALDGVTSGGGQLDSRRGNEMTNLPVNVIVVDDEPKLRALWQKVLSDHASFNLLCLLDSADDICAKVPADNVVMLLDLSMPGRDPMDALADLNAQRPGCRVIVYSGYSDADTVSSAIDAGAWGFVDKLSRVSEVLDTMLRVSRGETVFP